MFPFANLAEHLYHEDRFESLHRAHPETAALMLTKAQTEIENRWNLYRYLAAMPGRPAQ